MCTVPQQIAGGDTGLCVVYIALCKTSYHLQSTRGTVQLPLEGVGLLYVQYSCVFITSLFVLRACTLRSNGW
jgi:hypothetical protein